MTITREPWVRKDVADQIEALIWKWVHIIPPTFHTIKISSDSDDKCPASIRVHDEYRQATIVAGATWMELTTEDPERIIVHELCHLYTTPIARRGREAVDMLTEKESQANKLANDAITKSMECCNEDLTQTFLRIGRSE